MDATGLVFVTMTLNGILLVSPNPVTVEECKTLQDRGTTVMCIEQEPDCGKHAGKDPCLGQAWQEEQVKPAKKRKPVARKRVRRIRDTPVADVLRRAL